MGEGAAGAEELADSEPACEGAAVAGGALGTEASAGGGAVAAAAGAPTITLIVRFAKAVAKEPSEELMHRTPADPLGGEVPARMRSKRAR